MEEEKFPLFNSCESQLSFDVQMLISLYFPDIHYFFIIVRTNVELKVKYRTWGRDRNSHINTHEIRPDFKRRQAFRRKSLLLAKTFPSIRLFIEHRISPEKQECRLHLGIKGFIKLNFHVDALIVMYSISVVIHGLMISAHVLVSTTLSLTQIESGRCGLYR